MALLFAAAAVSNACLLFLVEPLVGKMVLPVLGGAPAVWNTLLLFFQTALLGGYLYSHLAGRLPLEAQVPLHAAVLSAGALLLPVGVPSGWTVPGVELPLAWVFGLAIVMAGGPFFALAAAAPLIQRWFSLTGHDRAHDPYFLYAATNAGSLAGLLAYPLLVEPALRLTRQAWLWGGGFIGAALLTVGCGLVALFRSRRLDRGPTRDAREAPGSVSVPIERDTERQPGWWLALAFVPSSLMLGVTTHVTTDIAAFPLVLIVPLALYLVTFILAFARRQIVPGRAVDTAYPLAALPVVFTYAIAPTGPFWLLVPLHLACFFVLALGCHRALARSRPAAGRLTGYYLWIAVGGVLGGVFNGVLAPIFFDSVLEYPLVVALACFLRPRPPDTSRRARGLAVDLLVATALGASVWPLQRAVDAIGLLDSALGNSVALGIVLVAASVNATVPRRFALGIAALLVAAYTQTALAQPALFAGRSYFGVLRVTEDAHGTRQLVHGSTIHGSQLRDGRRDLVPAAYYHPDGPAGEIMRQAGSDVAIVGLGTGAMACYARPGQQWVFFEIDPLVVRIARDAQLFTYLSGCLPDARVVIGDARVQLERVADGSYSALVVDAFNSDAIPVHLLTEESVRLYVRKLAQGGILALHISNRHVSLGPVLGRIAADLGLAGRTKGDAGDDAEHFGSTWAVIARSDTDLGALAKASDWAPLRTDAAPRWTDDYSNVLGALVWRSNGQ
ncbi:MAG: fused MFS/spermidine synthase [Acidobacteriota bacterium]